MGGAALTMTERDPTPYRSPREIAEAVLHDQIEAGPLRSAIKKRLIDAIIERDEFWKRQIKAIYR